MINLASVAGTLGLAIFMGCSDGVENDESAGVTGSPATAATNYNPVCNGGFRDGVCNALGAVPESCECLDCAETAYCLGKCVDDGTCQASERDEGQQTCADCFEGATVAETVAETSAEVSTSDASSGNGSSDAASTADASTAPATTAPSSSSAGGGAGGA